MPGVIVLDFGNVLAHFSHVRAAEQLAALSHLDPETIRQRVFGSHLEKAVDTGAISLDQFRNGLRELLEANNASDADLDFAFSNMFTRNSAICDAIPRLAQRYPLFLLSNTNAIHAAHFLVEYQDVLGHFKALVMSHEVGASKPDPQIYEYCQNRVGCPPTEILFVDDRADNVATARSLGWNALHYQPMHGLPDTLQRLLDETEAFPARSQHRADG
jgi:putative hydrolase of the HAD superfamily